MKSLQVTYEVWKKLKQSALDRDITVGEVVKELVENYL